VDVTPPAARIFTSRSESWRDARACLEISISRSNSRSWKYAEATLRTRLVITARLPHSLDNNWARAASVALRYFPQKSSSQNIDRFTLLALVSKGGKVLVRARRWLAAAAPPVIVGNW